MNKYYELQGGVKNNYDAHRTTQTITQMQLKAHFLKYFHSGINQYGSKNVQRQHLACMPLDTSNNAIHLACTPLDTSHNARHLAQKNTYFNKTTIIFKFVNLNFEK